MADVTPDNPGTKGSKLSPELLEKIQIPDEHIAEASYYARSNNCLLNMAMAQEITAIDAGRLRKILDEACQENTGKTIAEAGREALDPIERFVGLMETDTPELEMVKAAVAKIEDIRLSAEKKKRYIRLIDDVIELQAKALEDPAIFWVYVGRDSEADSETSTNRFGVFDMKPFHIEMFDLWSDKKKRYTLTLAPPGHAKSTNMRGNIAWRIGKQPKIRILLLALDVGKAAKEVQALMRIVKLPTYKAVFPSIRMLDRTDDVQKSSRGFTLASVDGDKSDFNIHSREPTISGFGINSSINGDGYSMIICDDIVNPKTKDEEYTRKNTISIFDNVVRHRLRDQTVAELHLVATPWHADDLYGRIKRDKYEGRSQKWTILEFPILDDDDGKAIPIWPEKADSESLEHEKGGEHYNCLFRLNPIHATGRLVKKMCFYPSLDNELMNDKERAKVKAIASGERWLSLDPAASDGKGSALNGVIDATFTHEGFLYVTEVHALRIAPVGFLDWVVEAIVSADPANPVYGVQMEAQASNKQAGDLFFQSLRKMLDEREYKAEVMLVQSNCKVGGVTQNRGKPARLSAASWPIETARVRFAGEKRRKPSGDGFWYAVIPDTMMEKLKDAVLNFKTSGDKDIVDALSQLILQNYERLRSAMPDKVKEENSLPMDPLSRLNREQMDATRQQAIGDEQGLGEFEDETLVFSCK